MKWNSLWGDNTSLGGYAEARDPDAAVDFLREDDAFAAAWPWEVKAAFGHGWDDLQTQTEAFIDVARARGTPTRRVIVSNEVDFFEDFVASHGDELEQVQECLGNEWDLLTASMGEVSARMRRSVEKLRGAEALASVVSLHDPRFLSGREAWRDEAFLNMGLFYEHDWTANSGLGWEPRAAFQRRSVAKVERYVDALHDDGKRALGGLIVGSGAPRVYAFNPLSWTRAGVVEVSVSVGGPRHVVDVTTGQEVPSQLEAGGARLVFLAQAVPAVGYRVYEVRQGVGQAWSPAAQVSGGRLDNGVVRVEVGSDGALSSLVDVGRGRELAGAGGLGRKVGDVGPDTGGAVEVIEAGPVRVLVQTLGEGFPAHRAEVALVRGSPRVELSYTVEENFSGEVGFGFDLAGVGRGVEVHHEELGMLALAKHKAQGGDYADALARVDWLTLGHFVDVSGAAGGVTVSSPDAAFFRLGDSTVEALDEGASSLVASVGMQVDGPSLGIPAQGGDARFLSRYALTPHAGYSPSGAMREALEHQNPLLAGPVTGGDDAPLPPDRWGLLSLDGPDVLLWALKPAEEGIEDGLIARVWNVGEQPREARLSMLARPLAGAERVTHVETRLGNLPDDDDAVTLALAPQQLATVRLRLGDVGGFDAGDFPHDDDPSADLDPSEDAADLDPSEDAAPPDAPDGLDDLGPDDLGPSEDVSDAPSEDGGCQGEGCQDAGALPGGVAPPRDEGCACATPASPAGSRLAPWWALALGLALWGRRPPPCSSPR
jgi:alpha-mannosidase